MSNFSDRKNQRSFVEARIVSNYPLESRARQERYSNLSQVVHPFGKAIHELNLNIEKSFHNYFAQSIEPSDMDMVYTLPFVFQETAMHAYINTTSTVALVKVEDNLDALWYRPIPTRLEIQDTTYKRTYPVRQATSYRDHYMYQSYNLDSHLSSSYIDRTGSSHWSTPGAALDIDYLSTSGWGNGDVTRFQFLDTSITEVSSSSISSTAATGGMWAFWANFKNEDTSVNKISSIDVEVGFQGVGSSVTTYTDFTQWQNTLSKYVPSAIETGFPYAKITLTKAAAADATDNFLLSDYSLIKYDQVESGTAETFFSYGMDSHDLNWAYVNISGGTNLFQVGTSDALPTLPASIKIFGIGPNNSMQEERIYLPYNGQHRSMKVFKNITKVIADDIYPRTASLNIQLCNYGSTTGVPDYVESYSDTFKETPLFYGINNTSGTCLLEYQTFLLDDYTQMVDGHDFTYSHLNIELLDTASSSHELADICLDQLNRHIYALDSSNSKIYIYDSYPHWPSNDKLKYLNERTTKPDMQIKYLSDVERFVQKDTSIVLEAIWPNRFKRLIKFRWKAIKPDGSEIGIDSSGTEVAYNTDYWIINDLNIDIVTKEFKFAQHRMNYTLDTYGDYVIILEAQYRDEDTARLTTEKDVLVVSVPTKIPLAEFTLDSVDTPVGIDFDYYGNLKVAYAVSNDNYKIREEVFKRRYDYYFFDNQSNKYFLREKYNLVKARRVLPIMSTVSCYKTMLYYTAAGPTPTVSELECAVVILETNSNTITLTLPSVGSSEDGLAVRIFRVGSNVATIDGNGTTINGAATKTLNSTYDSIDLIYSDDLGEWIY